jgi:hypothetical protein
MFPLNTILTWNKNIIMNKKYDNNNIIIASRAHFLHGEDKILYFQVLYACCINSWLINGEYIGDLRT